MKQFEVWLPGNWPSLNAMKEGAQRGGAKGGNQWNKIKQSYQGPALLLMRIEKRKKPVRFTVPVRIKYTHYRSNRRGDPSNYASAAQKIIEDALVEAGIIPNDTFRWIAGFEHEFYFVNKEPGVEVSVKEAKSP